MKKGESTKAKGKKKETVKAVSGGKSERGGMSPMAATHHSQLNDAIFFPLFPLLFRGRGWGGVQPASNQMGSNRVHILQVGPRKRTRCSRTSRSAITYFLSSPSCFLCRLKPDTMVCRTTVACKKGLQTSVLFLTTPTFMAEECIFSRVVPCLELKTQLVFCVFLSLGADASFLRQDVCLQENHSGFLLLPSGSGPAPTATLHICCSTQVHVCV